MCVRAYVRASCVRVVSLCTSMWVPLETRCIASSGTVVTDDLWASWESNLSPGRAACTLAGEPSLQLPLAHSFKELYLLPLSLTVDTRVLFERNELSVSYSFPDWPQSCSISSDLCRFSERTHRKALSRPGSLSQWSRKLQALMQSLVPSSADWRSLRFGFVCFCIQCREERLGSARKVSRCFLIVDINRRLFSFFLIGNIFTCFCLLTLYMCVGLCMCKSENNL